MGNNILVISTDQELHRHIAKKITATLLNAADGKPLQQKVIWTNTADVFVEPKVFNRKDGSLMALMLRYSNYKTAVSFSYEKKFQQTQKVELYGLDESLNASLQKTVNADENFRYWSSDMADNGNFFLMQEGDDRIVCP